MSLPRGVGSAGRLGEPLSRFPAGVSSELAYRTGYFGEGAAARDVSVINLCKKELKYSPELSGKKGGSGGLVQSTHLALLLQSLLGGAPACCGAWAEFLLCPEGLLGFRGPPCVLALLSA